MIERPCLKALPTLSRMRPTLVREPFHGDAWVYEEKYDSRLPSPSRHRRPSSSVIAPSGTPVSMMVVSAAWRRDKAARLGAHRSVLPLSGDAKGLPSAIRGRHYAKSGADRLAMRSRALGKLSARSVLRLGFE